MHFTVTVPSPQTILGHSYTFQSWSQGGAQQQTIVVPPVATTYMINFIPPKNYFTSSTPTLTWNRITWAISYDLQIANNAAFTNTPALYHVGNNLTFTPPTALNDGQYFWRVRACSASSCGTWSPADTFIVDGP